MSLEVEALERADLAVRAALDAGASEAEATFTVSDRFRCEARQTELTKLEQSRSRSLSIRVFVGKKRGSLATSELNDGAIRDAVASAVAAARYVGDDPYAGLAEGVSAVSGEDLAIWSGDVGEYLDETKIEEVRQLERLVRAYDERIDNSNGSRIDDVQSVIALANSNGFRGAYRSTVASRGTSPVARDGEQKRIGSYGSASRSYRALEEVEAIARQAGERAVALCGARKPKTMSVPVIFERDVAASVLGDLFTALSASNVAVGNSFLADRCGEKIGSDLATIIDDGRLCGGLGSSPFDAEGTPSQRTLVFDRGRLATFLYDTYYARKLSATTTANASGGGIGPNNFYLEPGEMSLAEIIKETKLGVLVLDTIGFATEHASGTYSRGARGLFIENGEIAYPIDEFTIASTFPSMLSQIDYVANDLRFDSGIVSPSFRVAEMTISGS